MEDKSGNKQKPLRPVSNRVKDLYNAYMRNEGTRSIPITGLDDEAMQNLEELLEGGDEMTPKDEPTNDTNEMTLQQEIAEEIQSLNDRIDVLEKERDEAKDQAIRKTAELENVIKRTQREKYDIIEFANEKLLLKFLSIIDDLTNAVDSARQSHDATSILTGIEMIHQKALKLLEDEGVKPIDNVVGHPFDVHFHEALLSMPSEIKEGHVVQEVMKGYTLRDKVIRHTKVVTSSGEPD
jgi:molecular chaperone GrpE